MKDKTVSLELLRCVPIADGELECSFEWREEYLTAQDLINECGDENER